MSSLEVSGARAPSAEAQATRGTSPSPALSAGSSLSLASSRQASQVTVRGVVALLLVTIVLQRFSLPVGALALPVVLPAGLLVLAYLVVRGSLRPTGPRLWAGMAALAALAGSAYMAARYSSQVQLTSLSVVMLIWAAWVLRVPGTGRANRDGFRRVGTAYVNIMTGLAVVGAVQLASQFVGLWRYTDVVSDVVPPTLLLPGYNTNIPIAFGSPIHKSQAFFFVEPSTFSQFTAVAIIVAVLLRVRLWRVAALGLGLVSALSGTGLVLLAFGLLLVLVRAPRLIRGVHVVAGVAALALVLVTPAAEVFSSRLDEFDSQTSSLSLRFVLPYQEVSAGMGELPQRWVTGAGAGAADRYLESGRERAGLYVVYPVPTKVLFEYGLIAAALFVFFMGVVLFRRPPTIALPGTILFWLFFLGGYLAAPHVVWAAWALSPAWSPRE
jgi:hypothetical protein